MLYILCYLYLVNLRRRGFVRSGWRELKLHWKYVHCWSYIKVFTQCFYLVESWHKEAFKEYEEERVCDVCFTSSCNLLLHKMLSSQMTWKDGKYGSHCFVEIADTVLALLCLKFSFGFRLVCIYCQSLVELSFNRKLFSKFGDT